MSQTSIELNASPAPADGPRVHLVQVDGTWLHNDGLHVCLVQTLHASGDDITKDASRPHAVSALRALLVDSKEIRDHGLDGGGQPSVIVGPELAIGSSDWETIDQAVRASSGQRMVIVGCGHVNGSWITHWLSQNTGPTVRLPGWPDDAEQILAARPYNVGFAWVKTPSSVNCVLFLKNSIDQSREQQLATNLTVGTWLIRMEAQDLVLFPLICSDFHQGITGAADSGSAAVRIRRSLNATSPGSRRILITGSLHTDNPGNGLWDRALVHVFEHVQPSPLIALVNGVCGIRDDSRIVCYTDPTVDAWRNRTGVYKALPVVGEHTRVHSQITLAAKSNSLEGVVIRESFPLLAGGKARWVRTLPDGAYLWHVPEQAVLDRAGVPTSINDGSALVYELIHASARRKITHDPRPEWAGSNQAEENTRFCTCSYRQRCSDVFTRHLCMQADSDVLQVGKALLLGCDLDNTRTMRHEKELSEQLRSAPFWPGLGISVDHALDAASLVWTVGARTVVDLPGCVARSVLATDTHRYLIWSSPWLTFEAMWRQADVWRRAADDGIWLVVIGRSASGDFDEAFPTQAPSRNDIAMPEMGQTVDVPRVNRQVWLYPIARLLERCQAKVGDTLESLEQRATVLIDGHFASTPGGAT